MAGGETGLVVALCHGPLKSGLHIWTEYPNMGDAPGLPRRHPRVADVSLMDKILTSGGGSGRAVSEGILKKATLGFVGLATAKDVVQLVVPDADVAWHMYTPVSSTFKSKEILG